MKNFKHLTIPVLSLAFLLLSAENISIKDNGNIPFFYNDGDVTTSGNISGIYVRIPRKDVKKLNIVFDRCPGAVNDSVTILLYSGVPVEGGASETSVLYTAEITGRISALPLSGNKTLYSADIDVKDLPEGKEYFAFIKNSPYPVAEIFFDGTYVSSESVRKNINKIYINDTENSLLADTEENKAEIIYSEPGSVLQLSEFSDDNRWAVLISMPADIEGRAETIYLLADISAGKIVNPILEKTQPDYLSGNMIFFDDTSAEHTVITYLSKDGDYKNIVIR